MKEKARRIRITFKEQAVWMTRGSHDASAVDGLKKRESESEYEISLTAFEGLSQEATIFIHHTLSGLSI